MALAIARQLFRSEDENEYFMELNASDERGIDTVRERIKSFASSVVKSTLHKFLILDEVDNMTTDAQNALRKIIEANSEVTRFCLICNSVSCVIDPLVSRCAVFRFKSLHPESIYSCISSIIRHEKLHISPKVAQKLGELCDGDLRKVINLLQSAVTIDGKYVTEETILKASHHLKKEQSLLLWKTCRQGQYSQACYTITTMLSNGFSAKQLLSSLLHHSLSDSKLNEEQRAKIFMHLGYTDKALIDGADEYLQILSLVTTIQRIMNVKELPDD
jgi:replication factor C subunit 2/4